MNRQQSQPVIHRHFHYHYHYDINQPSYGISQNYKQSRYKKLRNEKVGRQIGSWKKYINPDVTRMYKEISNRNRNFCPPDKSTFTIRKSNQYPTFFHPSTNQSNSLSQSQLFQDRQECEQYKKQLPNQNFDLPKTASFFMPQSQSNNHLEKQYQNEREKMTLDDNTRLEFSHINPKQSTIKNLTQTTHSSRFQRLPTQQSIRQESKISYTRDFPLYQFNERKSAKNTDYEYELMKEECEYLRSRFIEHIQKKHGVKL